MNLERKIVKDPAIGVAVTETPDGLSAIHRSGCAAAIWRRQPLSSFQGWIDTLSPEELPSASMTLKPDLVRKAIDEVCKSTGVPVAPERDILIDDIAALSDVFADQMKAPFLKLRLDVISANACKKFHIDAVTARLICTYRGAGTQCGVSTNGAEPNRIFTVPTGAPILLTGTEWPNDCRSGLLHRSPPIENTGATRLVLVLDPVYDAETLH